jgi:hypothetical protein
MLAALALAVFGAACRNNTTREPGPGAAPHKATYEIYLDLVDCRAVQGWAWDSGSPDGIVQLDIYDADVRIGTATAGIFRKDLLDAGKGNGKHAFGFVLPSTLKDGKPHAISVRISGASQAPANGTRTITCSP